VAVQALFAMMKTGVASSLAGRGFARVHINGLNKVYVKPM
jgi:hypothetical protein